MVYPKFVAVEQKKITSISKSDEDNFFKSVGYTIEVLSIASFRNASLSLHGDEEGGGGGGCVPGPHIRGNTLRAFSVGDKEVDLLLPGT